MIALFFARHRQIILYGSCLAILLFLLKWLEWRFIVLDHAIEIYSGAIAVVFTALGIWLALKLARPGQKIVVVEKEVRVNGVVDRQALARFCLSARELEVLDLMAEGLSNAEIASRLYVSLNTIKTHSSKIFEKMDVRRRTQAIDKARKLKIIV